MTANRALLVEKVAIRLADARACWYSNPIHIGICVDSAANCECKRTAKTSICAVLDAIAEPSEAVQLAGHNMRSDPVTGLSTSCGVDEIYRAMIAALRKEIEG